MQNTNVLLSVRKLKKYFPVQRKNMLFGERHYLRANEEISIDIKKGETFGLVGESGCGKSTFGRTVLQLYKPTSGEVVYYGKNEAERIPAYAKTQDGGVSLEKLSKRDLRGFRKDLQIIFQDPYSSLDPRMTVGQLIEEGVATHKLFPRGSKEMRNYVRRVILDCGLREDALYRYPHQFSGGQRQRISIARALAVKPKFMVCDECVSALDVSVQSQILNLLTDLKEKESLTYLFISHDLSVVRYLSDRIGVMYLGEIVEWGDGEEVFQNPRHPYTIALISAIPSISQRKEETIVLNGHMPSPVSPPPACRFHTRCFMACEICKRIPAPIVEVKDGHFVACHFAEKEAKEKRGIALKKENMEKS